MKSVVLVFLAAISSFGQITYSDTGWTLRNSPGPWGQKLHYSSTINAFATIQDTGSEVFIIHGVGPSCGIFHVVVDNNQATMKDIDTYAKLALWDKKTVIASNVTNGPHTIVVTVTGKKNDSATNAVVQLVDKWTLGRGVWPADKAWTWYASKPWIVGWNYIPSSCVNPIEWWQDETHASDSAIGRELALGEQLGYNTLRVFLPYIVWVKDSAALKNRFSRFLTIAASRHFTVIPVLFDDVNYKGKDPSLGDQGQPAAGQIMSQWTGSPGPTLAVSTTERPRLKAYIQDLIRTFAQDSRILMWDLYNSPGNSGMGITTQSLVELTFQWAREIGPAQPLTCPSWNVYNNFWPYDLSDICTFHACTDNAGVLSAINQLRCSQRPIIATEWFARKLGSSIAKDLPLFKRQGVGCLSWGLINGRTQCQYPWSNPVGGPLDSTGWFQDILYSSGKPYRSDEVDALRKNLAHKTIQWASVAAGGAIMTQNGCTDPRFAEYDSTATIDNNSCVALLPALVIAGCLDSTSPGYNPLATQNDPSMCIVGVIQGGPSSKMPKALLRELVGFMSNNRINIFGKGAVRIELFSAEGRLAWSKKADGPCVIDMGSPVKTGVYFARVFINNKILGVYPLYRVVK